MFDKRVIAIVAPSLVMFLMIGLWGADILAFFPGGICFGPLTFSVRTVDFHGGASISFVVDYIAGSWFPGRNL